MNTDGQLTEIQWHERPQGNRYRTKLHPAMLLPDGYKVLTQILLKGTGRRRSTDADRTWVNIVYDESYIVAKLQKEILEPLNPKDYNSFQAIVSKAWKIWKSSKEGDQQNDK